MALPILITGTPKCGSKYTVTMLNNSFGLQIGHERPGFKDGIVSWWAANPSYDDSVGIMPYRRQLWFENGFRKLNDFKTKLHQVREPINCINSLHAIHRGETIKYMRDCGVLPVNKSESLIRANREIRTITAMKIWYYWNLSAEKQCEWTYRIEDIADVFDEFCNRLGVRGDVERVKMMRTTINSWRRKPGYGSSTWESLDEIDHDLCSKIKELASRYGYEVPS